MLRHYKAAENYVVMDAAARKSRAPRERKVICTYYVIFRIAPDSKRDAANEVAGGLGAPGDKYRLN
jgi:hypothetical protein